MSDNFDFISKSCLSKYAFKIGILYIHYNDSLLISNFHTQKCVVEIYFLICSTKVISQHQCIGQNSFEISKSNNWLQVHLLKSTLYYLLQIYCLLIQRLDDQIHPFL